MTTTKPREKGRVIERDGARKSDLAAIHIAKARLGLDDDSYRDLVATVCAGVRSSAQLDYTGRKRLLSHLQACLVAHGKGQQTSRVIRGTLSQKQSKMWALWMALADAGFVTSRTMAALEAFATRQTGVDRLQWLNGHQEDLVIDSLKAWLKSRGVAS